MTLPAEVSSIEPIPVLKFVPGLSPGKEVVVFSILFMILPKVDKNKFNYLFPSKSLYTCLCKAPEWVCLEEAFHLYPVWASPDHLIEPPMSTGEAGVTCQLFVTEGCFEERQGVTGGEFLTL